MKALTYAGSPAAYEDCDVSLPLYTDPMKSPASAPRLEEVADLAGVSTATVSRYINGSSYVAKNTAVRIQRAIDELGYLPNLLAGSLATNRSRLVAILVPQLAQSLFNSTIEALVAALELDGYTSMLGISGVGEARLGPLIDAALSRRAEAIILTGIIADERIRDKLKPGSATVIETWGLPENPIDVAIGFSHAEVGQATARFVRGRGYSRPLIVSAHGTRAMLRRDGFVTEWQASGGGEFAELEVDSPSRFSQARSVFRSIRQQEPRPDVVICGSDGLAQGLLIEAAAAGLSVPDELAVIGFGNLSIAADMRPSITTIAVDGDRLGHEAAAVMRERAQGRLEGPRVIDIGFQLIERESA
jgi:LacI family gluconate utilization system Gnt-I transcriptional repressor